MKKAVLLLSKNFPATHPRAGESTNFEGNICAGLKIHTIRDNIAYWQKKAEQINAGSMTLFIKEWTGRPYYSDQREIRQIQEIGLQRISMTYDRKSGELACEIDGKPYPDIKQLAANDGLYQLDFIDWFFGNRKQNQYSGTIIHFTGFRY